MRNNFDLSAPTDRGTYQFYHNLKGQISDNPQAKYALAYTISQSATNAATDADGKSHRGALMGSLAYRITRKINGETVKTGMLKGLQAILHWPHLLQAMPLGAMHKKRLMKILSDNLVDELIMVAAKGEIEAFTTESGCLFPQSRRGKGRHFDLWSGSDAHRIKSARVDQSLGWAKWR